MLTSYFHYTESIRKIKHSAALRRIIWQERVVFMKHLTFYIPENTPALYCAERYLAGLGCTVTHIPMAEVTHLLLSVPTGNFEEYLENLPPEVTLCGGNLPSIEGRKTIDLLADPIYTAKNAMITAHCALQTAAERLPVTWTGTRVLVVGWGRIGKCLASLLYTLGADVTVAARKPEDRAMAIALGCDALDTDEMVPALPRFRVIFNTAPRMLLPDTGPCRRDCIKIDLASKPGIGGEGVVWARGLPGKMAPESAGRLIGETVLRLIKEE